MTIIQNKQEILTSLADKLNNNFTWKNYLHKRKYTLGKFTKFPNS